MVVEVEITVLGALVMLVKIVVGASVFIVVVSEDELI